MELDSSVNNLYRVMKYLKDSINSKKIPNRNFISKVKDCWYLKGSQSLLWENSLKYALKKHKVWMLSRAHGTVDLRSLSAAEKMAISLPIAVLRLGRSSPNEQSSFDYIY